MQVAKKLKGWLPYEMAEYRICGVSCHWKYRSTCLLYPFRFQKCAILRIFSVLSSTLYVMKSCIYIFIGCMSASTDKLHHAVSEVVCQHLEVVVGGLKKAHIFALRT